METKNVIQKTEDYHKELHFYCHSFYHQLVLLTSILEGMTWVCTIHMQYYYHLWIFPYTSWCATVSPDLDYVDELLHVLFSMLCCLLYGKGGIERYVSRNFLKMTPFQIHIIQGVSSSLCSCCYLH